MRKKEEQKKQRLEKCKKAKTPQLLWSVKTVNESDEMLDCGGGPFCKHTCARPSTNIRNHGIFSFTKRTARIQLFYGASTIILLKV